MRTTLKIALFSIIFFICLLFIVSRKKSEEIGSQEGILAPAKLQNEEIKFFENFNSWYHKYWRKGEAMIVAVSKTTPSFLSFVYNPINDNYDSREILEKGEYHGHVVNLLNGMKKLAGHRLRFLDIGANKGYLTLAAASVGYDVISVEPSPQHSKLLQSSVAINVGLERRIKLFKVALTDYSQSKTSSFLHLCEEDPTNRGMTVISSRTDVPCSKVPVTTLDSLLQTLQNPTIDLMKMDVEGYEVEILNGAVTFFESANKPKVIVLEFNTNVRNNEVNRSNPYDMVLFCLKYGYHIFDYYGNKHFSNEKDTYSFFKESFWANVPSGHTDIACYNPEFRKLFP